MTLICIALCIVVLVLLISVFKIHPFPSFLVASVLAAVLLGLPVEQIAHSLEKGIGDMLSSLLILIAFGAMFGKIIAVSGAAQRIATTMMNIVGAKNIQWAMMVVGFIVGIPLFYGVGFVLMVPLIFSVTHKYKLPAVYTGLPMLAALSVTHGYLPPHPSPSALVVQFGANMGLTLLYGICLAIPAIIVAGPFLAKFLKKIPSEPLKTFIAEDLPEEQLPGTFNSFLTALLPVILLIFTTVMQWLLPEGTYLHKLFLFFGSPSIVLMLVFLYALFSLGILQGHRIETIMASCTTAVKDVAAIILIIAGSGALKQIFTDTGVSEDIASSLQSLPIPPLALGWFIAAIIRACVGSATVAGLTTGSMILPLIASTGTDPNLMVLAVGAGSLAFSHVNDSGFWMFKEYFNLSVRDTVFSWSAMEFLVAIVGLIGVLILSTFI